MFWIGLIIGTITTATLGFIATLYLISKAYQLGREDEAETMSLEEWEQLQKIRQKTQKN